MQGLRAVEAREVELLEDVQRLADRRPTAGGRRHAVDVEPAIVDERRLAERHIVGGQVGSLEQARTDDASRALDDGRLLRGLDDLAAEATFVQPIHASNAELRVGQRQIGVAEDRADRGGIPAGQEQLGSRVKSSKRSKLSRVCWRKISSTTNPRAATTIAPRSAWSRDSVPTRPVRAAKSAASRGFLRTTRW